MFVWLVLFWNFFVLQFLSKKIYPFPFCKFESSSLEIVCFVAILIFVLFFRVSREKSYFVLFFLYEKSQSVISLSVCCVDLCCLLFDVWCLCLFVCLFVQNQLSLFIYFLFCFVFVFWQHFSVNISSEHFQGYPRMRFVCLFEKFFPWKNNNNQINSSVVFVKCKIQKGGNFLINFFPWKISDNFFFT